MLTFLLTVLCFKMVLTWKVTRNYSTKHQYKTHVGHTEASLPS